MMKPLASLAKELLLSGLAVLVLLSLLADGNAISIYESSNCTVHTSEGTLDLSPLANTDGTPRFTGIKLTYYGEISVNWNPCYDYSEPTGTVCDGVAACVLVRYGPLVHRSLGSNTNSRFGIYELAENERNEWYEWQEGLLHLRYETQADRGNGEIIDLTLDVFFECDSETDGEITPKISDGNRLALMLKSRHACLVNEDETGITVYLSTWMSWFEAFLSPTLSAIKSCFV